MVFSTSTSSPCRCNISSTINWLCMNSVQRSYWHTTATFFSKATYDQLIQLWFSFPTSSRLFSTSALAMLA